MSDGVGEKSETSAPRRDLPEYAVLLFRGRGIISALIRWQTRSCYSHAALLLPDGRIIESWQGAGVRIRRLDDWDGVDIFTVPGMTDEMWRDVSTFGIAHLGDGYDYWAIIRFISRNRMPDNNRWFCSELVFAAFQYAGVDLLARIHDWAVDPGKLSISPYLVQQNRGSNAAPTTKGTP